MSIKSSQSLVEEAKKKVQTLNPNEVKQLVEKRIKTTRQKLSLN